MRYTTVQKIKPKFVIFWDQRNGEALGVLNNAQFQNLKFFRLVTFL
jgi:hypothetical protein